MGKSRAAGQTDGRPFPWGRGDVPASNANFYASRDPVRGDEFSFGSRTTPGRVSITARPTTVTTRRLIQCQPLWCCPVWLAMSGSGRATYTKACTAATCAAARRTPTTWIYALWVRQQCHPHLLQPWCWFSLRQIINFFVPGESNESIQNRQISNRKIRLYWPLIKSLQTGLLVSTGIAGYLSARTRPDLRPGHAGGLAVPSPGRPSAPEPS